MDFEIQAISKILFLTSLAFVVTMMWTPVLTHFLYKYRLGKNIRDDGKTPIYSKLHLKKAGTPTMGGVLIWGTTLLFAISFFYLSKMDFSPFIKSLNFLSRKETLLPLGALVATALVGLLDDIFNIKKIGSKGGGLKVKHKLLIYTAIAIIGAYWFFYRLEWDVVRIPFLGNFEVGWAIIPIFIFIIVASTFSVNETDGLDGLAGGVMLNLFAAYTVICFLQGRYDLAVFCGVIMGALLAFLWFNINPARFIMGDTGSMSLGVTIGVIAMLTNTVLILPVIGLILVIESMSVIIQLTSKKLFGKKVFYSTPIHHHFEAMGWPEPKIVMRFWVISSISAAVGLIIYILDKFFLV